jgi:hypothetical protein
MDLTPQVYTAKVMHKRLFPKVNQFTYGVYYVALPLPAATLPSRWLSFQNKDYGNRDGGDVGVWARGILTEYGLQEITEHITLITMPRVLGYAFNPVSFFMCLDQDKRLRAPIMGRFPPMNGCRQIRCFTYPLFCQETGTINSVFPLRKTASVSGLITMMISTINTSSPH